MAMGPHLKCVELVTLAFRVRLSSPPPSFCHSSFVAQSVELGLLLAYGRWFESTHAAMTKLELIHGFNDIDVG